MSKKEKNLSNLMWVEKYRPSTLNEVINQTDIVRALHKLVNIPSELPHLLFAGPPGVGKTIVAVQLLGEQWRRDTLELNAQDKKGVKMVLARVKEIAPVMTKKDHLE